MAATQDASSFVDTLQLFRQEQLQADQASPSDEEIAAIAAKLANDNAIVDFIKNARVTNDAIKAQAPETRLVSTATPMVFSGYSHQTPANVTPHWSIGVMGSFYVNEDNTSLSCKTSFIGVGVNALPFNKGTLYYNNYDDLKGDCDVWVHTASAYFGITFSRNGSAFAEYAGGGVPSVGVFRGSGEWTR